MGRRYSGFNQSGSVTRHRIRGSVARTISLGSCKRRITDSSPSMKFPNASVIGFSRLLDYRRRLIRKRDCLEGGIWDPKTDHRLVGNYLLVSLVRVQVHYAFVYQKPM